MTPAQYRHIRQSLGLTQAQLAEQLGVALNTISRRELGQIAIEREAELALHCIVSRVQGLRKKDAALFRNLLNCSD